ncbi:MAG: response regulator [Thermodesulfobacteriota bacterium]|nr:response regulator [Thermodesulfobacteriota bacterium]
MGALSINDLNGPRSRVSDQESSEKDRKKAEEALLDSRQQLYQAQKMEALGTLVAGVAHEINNPLGLIIYNIPLFKKVWNDILPLMEEHAKRDPDRKYGGLTFDFLHENFNGLLSDVDMAANRVAKIVTDLKNFARQSNVLNKRVMQINTAVENAVRLAKTTVRKSGVDLAVRLGENLPSFQGDLQSIEQIVLNLVINSIQAIDHSRGKVEIVTGFQKDDGHLYLLVKDNGRGVSQSIADKIFDPFVTDKLAQGGTGLGLSVTYSLVNAHDGKISFESHEGAGATFRVTFPTIMRRKAAKILVVDDDVSIRRFLTEALVKDQPYLVDEASNGIEACIKLGTYRPDLLILDMFMPEMDGLEVCRTIRAEPKLSRMKVIITTGFPNHPKVKEVVSLGFADIYRKPYDLSEFLKIVGNILSQP